VDDYLSLNASAWDDRAAAHAGSVDYAVEQFVADPTFLSEVVRFDRPRLGDLSGLTAVHLQCHIGTDTLSLARLGARLTGLDFSSASLAQARTLAARAGTEIDYVEADVYRALEVLEPGAFDLVYTGIGALCWLPSITRWATVVAGLLKPGGRLFVREGHPMLWALDSPDGALELRYPYFETAAPVIEVGADTYVRTDLPLTVKTFHSWNHGLGEIISALMAAGLELTGLEEHDSAPWEALPGLMVKDDRGEWRLAEAPERLAASYTLQARRRA
jgi:SAM-dependent methyltransferase